MTNLAKRRRALMMRQGGEPPFYINGYVGNGLTHYYDGIDNRGIGVPRSTSAPWRDYNGDNPLVTQPYGKFSYTDNAAIWSGWRNTGYITENFVAALTKMTVECRMSSDNTSGSGTGFSIAKSTSSGSYMNLRCSPTTVILNGGGKTHTISTDPGFHTAAISLDFEKNEAIYYVDGEKVAENTISQPVSALNDSSHYTTTGTSYYVSPANGSVMNPGYVQRIATYNRVLTPAEISYNYQNDLARFT